MSVSDDTFEQYLNELNDIIDFYMDCLDYLDPSTK